MIHGSLFSGIGGFDEGFRRAGIPTAWAVDINSYCRKVIRSHSPGIKLFNNIREVSGRLSRVDIISGGFPCPAFSRQGLEGGFEQDDLFYEMIKICDELKPWAIVFENVEGFKKWREYLHAEVENIGYEWGDAIIDARDYGIPQCRRRYFAICIRGGIGLDTPAAVRRKRREGFQQVQPDFDYTERRWTPTVGSKEEWRAIHGNARTNRDHTGIPFRMDRLTATGNAVPPQIAEIIGHRLMEITCTTDLTT